MVKPMVIAILAVALVVLGYSTRQAWLWRVEPVPTRLTIVRWGSSTPRLTDSNPGQVAALYESLAASKPDVSMDTKCSFALYRLTFYRGRVADGWADLEIPCSGMNVDIAGSLRYVQVPEFSSPVWGELATIWHLPQSRLINLGMSGTLPGVQKYRRHPGA